MSLRKSAKSRNRRGRRAGVRSRRLFAEQLEVRSLLAAIITVNSTGDVSATDSVLTLREAIQISNRTLLVDSLTALEQAQISGTPTAGDADTIVFAIPANDPGHVHYRNDNVPGQVSRTNVTQTTVVSDDQLLIPDPDWPHSWWSIQPSTDLPVIADPVTLDGFSQTGARPNTNAASSGLGLNSVLTIELQGARNSDTNVGLIFPASDLSGGGTLRGLTINSIPSVISSGANGGKFQGNFIGTDVSGTILLDAGFGISIGGSGNQIGGTNAADRNLIVGDSWSVMIESFFSNSTNNVVQGNLIGTDATGTKSFNTDAGVFLFATIGAETSENVIGGAIPDARNLISGSFNGIYMRALGDAEFGASSVSRNHIQGNYIGTNVTGSAPLGNYTGIRIETEGGITQQNTVISNRIAYNANKGIVITGSAASNSILSNSIFSHGVLGIDLGDDFITYNDVGDPDGGVNGLQNFPIISHATKSNGLLRLTYQVDSLPAHANFPLRVEFFESSVIPGAQHSGKTFLGFDTYTAADFAAGLKTIEFAPLAPVTIDGSAGIVATATDSLPSGGPADTSEFSPSVVFTSPWHNVVNPLNVDANLGPTPVAPFDAVLIINHINATGGGPIPVDAANSPPYLDVDGSNIIGPNDAVQVINWLNAHPPTTAVSGESESPTAAPAELIVWDPVVVPQEAATGEPTPLGVQVNLPIVGVGGLAYFAGNDGVSGQSLWKSDGTLAGTTPVASPTSFFSGPLDITDVSGTIFFAANFQLWKSDGTTAEQVSAAGLEIVSDSLTNANGTLFFAARDAVHGYELWRSDGTAAGTVLVKDIRPGAASSEPRELTSVGGTLFLKANDGTHGDELWKSDGTAAGTVLVRDINPGSNFSRAFELTDVNGTLLFRAHDGVRGNQLWRSDGTAAGTVLVKDGFARGTDDLSDYFAGPRFFTNVNGTLLFSGNDGVNGFELWRSDGTTAGTKLVKVTAAGDTFSGQSYLTNANGTLYFANFDEPSAASLWKSDGTPEGTVPVVSSSPAAGAPRIGPSLVGVGDELFFGFSDVAHGPELWRSNGTAAGTSLVADLTVGLEGSFPRYLTNVRGTLFFTAVNTNTSLAELHSLAVNSVANSAPSFTNGPDQIVRRDSGPQAVAAWATNISPGPAADADQRVWFEVTNDNPALFSQQPALDPSGRLTYSPAPGAIGSATVTVRLRDDGATAHGGLDASPPVAFAITVQPPSTGIRLLDGVLEIVGTAHADRLTVNILNGKLQISGMLGTAKVNAAFVTTVVRRITAELGGGYDSLTIGGTVLAPAFIDAGPGNDTIIAGGGTAIILGGAGHDTLRGGNRRDILIGGAGADGLYSNGASDLLIDGTTTHDQDPTAWRTIHQEWNSNRTLAQRMSNVRRAEGPILQSTGIQLRASVTVFSDTAVDTLFGGGDNDWFFADRTKDRLSDRSTAEAIG